eukprot:355903-Chlamydomonas_euryale.AAC.17
MAALAVASGQSVLGPRGISRCNAATVHQPQRAPAAVRCRTSVQADTSSVRNNPRLRARGRRRDGNGGG